MNLARCIRTGVAVVATGMFGAVPAAAHHGGQGFVTIPLPPSSMAANPGWDEPLDVFPLEDFYADTFSPIPEEESAAEMAGERSISQRQPPPRRPTPVSGSAQFAFNFSNESTAYGIWVHNRFSGGFMLDFGFTPTHWNEQPNDARFGLALMLGLGGGGSLLHVDVGYVDIAVGLHGRVLLAGRLLYDNIIPDERLHYGFSGGVMTGLNVEIGMDSVLGLGHGGVMLYVDYLPVFVGVPIGNTDIPTRFHVEHYGMRVGASLRVNWSFSNSTPLLVSGALLLREIESAPRWAETTIGFGIGF